REGTDSEKAPRAEREPAGRSRQPAKQQERDRKNEHATAELVAASEERRRPARPDEKHNHREHRPARGDAERDGKREPEDCEQQDLVHAHVLVRIERETEVVEVEEATPEAAGGGRSVQLSDRKGDAGSR